MKINIITTLLIILTVVAGCNFSDKKSHPSYKELEKTISTLELNNKFNITEIEVSDWNLSDTIAIHNFPNKPQLKSRNLTANYNFKIIGKNNDFEGQTIVCSVDSLNWEVKQLIITEHQKTESSTKETNYIWDLVAGAKREYDLSHQVKIEQYNN